MKTEKRNDKTGHDEDMQREKPRQRLGRDNRSSKHQMDQIRADEWNSSHNRRSNSEAPIGILIKSQNLPGECHAQRAQKENTAADPGELTRIFVGSKQECLDEMRRHDRHHKNRSPVVHGAKKPAEELFIIEVLEAGPSLAR